MAEFNGKKGHWVTTESGSHVFIESGKSFDEAVSDAFGKENASKYKKYEKDMSKGLGYSYGGDFTNKGSYNVGDNTLFDDAGKAVAAVEDELGINPLDSKENFEKVCDWLVKEGYADDRTDAENLIKESLSEQGLQKYNNLTSAFDDDNDPDNYRDEEEKVEGTNYKNVSEADVDKYFDKLNNFNPNRSFGEKNQLFYDKEFFKESLKYDDPKKQFIEHNISRFGSKNKKDDEKYYSKRFDEIVEGISQGDNLQDPIQNDKKYINAVNKFKKINKPLPKDYEEAKEAMRKEVFDKYNNEANKSDKLWKEKYEPLLDAYVDLSNTYFKYGKYKNK